jgi:hypothetical protein
MGGIKLAVDRRAAVQVDDRAVARPFPRGNPVARLLVVFGDRTVVDRIEEAAVDRDALPGFGRLERRKPLGGHSGRLFGRCRRAKQVRRDSGGAKRPG